MNDQIGKQSSIINRFIDGSITIDSIKEFEQILKILPESPVLRKTFADLLVRKESLDAAVDEYNEAAKLFIDNGMTLQAIASKIPEWQIAEPSHEEYQAFYSALQESKPQDTPINNFFVRMACPEYVAIMEGLVRGILPAGKMVKKFRNVEDDISFIVSGALNKRTYHHLEGGKEDKRTSSEDLIENNFFGDIYPLEEEIILQSDIETITRVELLKLSKQRLMGICKEYPNVELLLKELYKARSESGKISSQAIRKTVRYEVPTRVKMKSFQDKADSKGPLVFEGLTQDISLGGTCITLGTKYQIGPSADMIGKNVNIHISVPRTDKSINILGTIAWSKEVSDEGKTTVIVGVEFKDMTITDRELLKKYFHGSDGADNLICSLWEALMKK
ncbi:MAG: PilZ domain-containing protein [Thermodesulfobacteriota bacterium]|nr:PilZ domain-containing protein [Thermodesulfobacteriota bacterium]